MRADVVKYWLEIHEPTFEKYNLDDLCYSNFDQEVKDYFDNEEHIFINWQWLSILQGNNNQHYTGTDSNGNPVSFPVRAYKNIAPSTHNDLPVEFDYSSVYMMTITEDKVLQAFEDIYAGNDADYYLDEAVNRALQDDSTVIDSDMYDQLRNLFKSEDEANHTMAMEVMANANVEKSAKYIYKLFEQFNNSQIPYNKSYNSVNFKSLCDTCGIHRYTSFDNDNYILFLHKYNQLGPDVVSEIREIAMRRAREVVVMEFRNLPDSGLEPDM